MRDSATFRTWKHPFKGQGPVRLKHSLDFEVVLIKNPGHECKSVACAHVCRASSYRFMNAYACMCVQVYIIMCVCVHVGVCVWLLG